MKPATSHSKRSALVICDPIETLAIHKDTSIALMYALLNRSWSVSFTDANKLWLKAGQVYANAHSFSTAHTGEHAPNERSHIKLASAKEQALSAFDLVLMRVDPPVDDRYLKLTWLLDFASTSTTILNPPAALQQYNEKMSSLNFSEAAPTLISTRAEDIKRFAQEHKRIVVKPLNAMGGRNVYKFHHDDSNLTVLLDELLPRESALMAQAYLNAIESSGDVRVIVIDGEPVEFGLARKPQAGDHRGNLLAHADANLHRLDDHQLGLARKVGCWLKERGIVFAGLDIIGHCLTEINITSPTCVRELENLGAGDISSKIIDACIKKVLEMPQSINDESLAP